ncbi:hypothetical protein ACIBAG_45385 [Streptomyces sp. NPDC051243]|uniref:hypothetical protein n=1 Tax=Streptomyces sp. NPDC051243 TaxID=3365646 RepID=UPI0037A11641
MDTEILQSIPERKSLLSMRPFPLFPLVTDKSPVRHVTAERNQETPECDGRYAADPSTRNEILRSYVSDAST